jgi:DNA-binding winged helix-turn-helix (wHTH) protein
MGVMSVTPIRALDRDWWRLPGCDSACQPRWHDPHAHESYGRALERAALSATMTTGRLAIDFTTQIVTVDGNVVHLTATEYWMLRALAERVGQVVSHREILAAVWRGELSYLSGVRAKGIIQVNLSRLRRRLVPIGNLIVTVKNRGVRLDAVPVGEDSTSSAALVTGWARDWDACRGCSRRDRAYQARGLCVYCYTVEGRVAEKVMP